MRYTCWADVVARYPGVSKIVQAEATAVEGAYIAGAESDVDAVLSARYTVPFASTPTLAPGIIRDISTDMAYYRIMFLSIKAEQSKILWDSIERRLYGLACGSMTLVSSGGIVVYPAGVAFGTHKSFPNISGVDSVESWKVSDLEADAQEDKRDL